VQDQDGGNAQHGKERTQHHKHLQKGLSERRGPRRRVFCSRAEKQSESADTASMAVSRGATDNAQQ
jgi:hypothetical protein